MITYSPSQHNSCRFSPWSSWSLPSWSWWWSSSSSWSSPSWSSGHLRSPSWGGKTIPLVISPVCVCQLSSEYLILNHRSFKTVIRIISNTFLIVMLENLKLLAPHLKYGWTFSAWPFVNCHVSKKEISWQLSDSAIFRNIAESDFVKQGVSQQMSKKTPT